MLLLGLFSVFTLGGVAGCEFDADDDGFEVEVDD
jgi:hypothetical protein